MKLQTSLRGRGRQRLIGIGERQRLQRLARRYGVGKKTIRGGNVGGASTVLT